MSYQDQENARIIRAIFKFLIGIAVLIAAWMWGYPTYRVYSEEKRGEAEFKRAEQNRKIQIEEAKAKNEAAISEAEAMIKIAEAKNASMIIAAQGERQSDSIRAIGVARSNEIIGSSLKNNKEYLNYLWVKGIYTEGNERIYIPTESQMPILEAK